MVLVPVLGRPERAQPLADSLAASVTGPLLEAEILFLVSPGDDVQEAACRDTRHQVYRVPWAPGPGDYARKINLGATSAQAGYDDDLDFVLLGADDLEFHRGWLEAALVAQLQTGACVVGTNDLGNASVIRGDHATHPLVHVAYLEEGLIDDPTPGLLLNPAYDHNFVDNELVGTAKARGTFVHAPLAYVEHLHPIWKKGEYDATYDKGQAKFHEDSKLHASRRHLWEKDQ